MANNIEMSKKIGEVAVIAARSRAWHAPLRLLALRWLAYHALNAHAPLLASPALQRFVARWQSTQRAEGGIW